MPKLPLSRLILVLATVSGGFLAQLVNAASPTTNAPGAKPAATNAGAPQTLEATEADKAWIDFQRACRPPPPSPDWGGKPPTQEQQQKYFLPFVIAAADKARNYYTKFPKETMAPTAKLKEHELLQVAVSFGASNIDSRLSALEKELLADPKLSDESRFHLRQSMVEHAAGAKADQGMDAVMAELEKGVRELQKDFPKRPEVAEMLLQVANYSEPTKAREILKEIVAGPGMPEVKAVAQNSLNKFEKLLGKPLAIKFTAVDGRPVDVEKMQGKVVLIDFWATWCGPCRAALPEVKQTYKKYHEKGLEIVGIDLDDKKDTLQQFTKDQGMEWPQYFDGLKWGNNIAKQYEIESIPTMWLVDKKGNLRDMNGRNNLAQKVEKLLAE